MSEKERNIEYRGRIKIYTDVKEITKDNVIQVLSTAMTKHELNRTQIRNLINFEKGDQPLMREKNAAALDAFSSAAAAEAVTTVGAPSETVSEIAPTSAEAAFAAAVSVPAAQPGCSASDEGRRLSLFSVIICTVPFARRAGLFGVFSINKNIYRSPV